MVTTFDLNFQIESARLHKLHSNQLKVFPLHNINKNELLLYLLVIRVNPVSDFSLVV